jgi:hypothetical protein
MKEVKKEKIEYSIRFNLFFRADREDNIILIYLEENKLILTMWSISNFFDIKIKILSIV